MTDIYRELIIDAAQYPHNYGTLEGNTISMQQLNPSCGDDVTVFVKLSQDQNQLIDIKWQGDGCVISKASMSLLSDHVKGMDVADINHLQKHDLEELLGLEHVAPGREKCLLIGLVALKKALDSVANESQRKN